MQENSFGQVRPLENLLLSWLNPPVAKHRARFHARFDVRQLPLQDVLEFRTRQLRERHAGTECLLRLDWLPQIRRIADRWRNKLAQSRQGTLWTFPNELRLRVHRPAGDRRRQAGCKSAGKYSSRPTLESYAPQRNPA